MRPHPLAALLACLPLSLLSLAPPPPPTDPQPQADPQPRPVPTILTGRITDAQGNPVPNVKVLLYNGIATRWLGQQTQTDADGNYRFEPLATGAHITRDGALAAYSVGIRLEHPSFTSADGANWWDIRVPFGDTARKDFALTPGARLSGNITDHEGFRWGDFSLRIAPADPKASKIGVYYAKTDHRGRFDVAEAIYPGRYQVQWNEPHADDTVLATITLDPDTTTHLTIPLRLTVEPQEVKVEVHPAAPQDDAAADE